MAGKKRPDLAQRNQANALHGGAGTRLFHVWDSMKQRCNNPRHHAFKDYGGRGITVCARWESFSNFRADMGERPGPGYCIDRIDNDGPYSPENCRWVTTKENARNRRSSVLVEFAGVTKTVAEWAETVGLERKTLENRLRVGWPVSKALNTPSTTNRKNTNGNFTGFNIKDAA